MSLFSTLTVNMPSISASILLSLLVFGTNAAHTPSPKQLGDIIILAQNNLRSKFSLKSYCPVFGPTMIGFGGALSKITS